MDIKKVISVIFNSKKQNSTIRNISLANKAISASRQKTKYDATEDNLRELQSYREAEIERYMFIATLDVRTCAICGNLDGKVFKVSEAKVGINCPPIHGGCRCTTVAYFGRGDLKNSHRRARNPITGKTDLIPHVTYNQWRKKHGL
jgi:SPP1 gp7 family putative phage head morphogenesis protein